MLNRAQPEFLLPILSSEMRQADGSAPAAPLPLHQRHGHGILIVERFVFGRDQVSGIAQGERRILLLFKNRTQGWLQECFVLPSIKTCASNISASAELPRTTSTPRACRNSRCAS